MNTIMENKTFFTPEVIESLTKDYEKVQEVSEPLFLKFVMLELESTKAKEYATQGFVRRIKTLQRCIENVYTICPLDNTEKLAPDHLSDIGVNLQSFVLNIFGCFDNLAWIWVKEKNILTPKGEPLKNIHIGLRKPLVKDSFSKEFKEYLEGYDSWFNQLEDFRHALAHRIPLYVPPFTVNEEETKKYHEIESQFMPLLQEHRFDEYEKLKAEQDSLGTFRPWMAHSFEEGSPHITFHAQILIDWVTIVEIAEKFLEELKK